MKQIPLLRIPVLLVFFLQLVRDIQAGTDCPTSQDLGSWLCTTVKTTPVQQFTILACQGQLCWSRSAGSSIANIPPTRGVYDRVIMSWTTDMLLPGNWLEYVRVRELEVVDSVLPRNFLNNTALMGQGEFLTRMSFRNSSLDKPVWNRYLNQNEESVFPNLTGISHLEKLEFLDLSYNFIVSIKNDSIPSTLTSLETLDLSHNRISTIQNQSLSSLISLTHLNLSHNQLKNISRQVFNMDLWNVGLKTLDLSWNYLSSLPTDMFLAMISLEHVDVSHNMLQSLHVDTWKFIQNRLTVLNAAGNFIYCDCNTIWIDDLPETTIVFGTCASPASHEGRQLRGISNGLNCPDRKKWTLLEETNNSVLPPKTERSQNTRLLPHLQ